MLDLISLIMFAFSGKLSSPNDVTVLLKLLLTYWTSGTISAVWGSVRHVVNTSSYANTGVKEGHSGLF